MKAAKTRIDVYPATHGYLYHVPDGVGRYLALLDGFRVEGTLGQDDYRLMRFERNDIKLPDNEGEDNDTAAKRLGMTATHYVNAHGLPNPGQLTTARDLAVLAIALARDFPQYYGSFHADRLDIGNRHIEGGVKFVEMYSPYAEGLKTGFICASGFNLVASATRNNKRLIAVVLGAPSSPYRSGKAASLLERGFHRGPLSWLAPSLGTVEALKVADANATPPDLRDAMCGRDGEPPHLTAESWRSAL